MKKLLFIFAIGAFVACNDTANEDGTGADTLVNTGTDTTVIVPAPDTLVVKPDTSAIK